MATKSFLKSVNVKDNKQIRIFAGALEKAEQYRDKNVASGRIAYEVSAEKVQRLLSKYRNG